MAEIPSVSSRLYSIDPDMAVRQIKKQWDLYASDVPFEYSFLNRKYEQLYDTYRRTGEIFGYTMLIDHKTQLL